MPWRLRRDYQITHRKTGQKVDQVSFHEGFVIGCPLGTSRPDGAKIFATKAIAQSYNRNKLPGRGYVPERIA